MKIIPREPQIINGINHYSVDFQFTVADILFQPPLPPPTSPNDVRNVLMRKIEQDVLESVKKASVTSNG